MQHCPNCGNELQAGTKFCPKCGQAISAEEPTSAESQAPVTLAHQSHEPFNQGVTETPRVPVQRRNSNQALIITIVLVLVIFLSGFLFIKKRVVVSREQLASNITKAVQNQDGKLFLKQFSKDDQDLKFSDVGAKSVVKDMHNHSRDSLGEVGRIIVDGRSVAGTTVKYQFNVEHKQVLGLFTSYYLTTRRTPVRVLDYTGSGGPVTIKLKDADNQRVPKQLLNSGFFPGKYNFDVRSGDTQGDYWIWAAGDGETIDLTLTSDD